MFQLCIPHWISTQSYLLNSTNSLISIIVDGRLGIHYVLKGETSRLWKIIYSTLSPEKIIEYAQQNGLYNLLQDFLGELISKQIIKVSGVNINTPIKSFKYLTKGVSTKSESFIRYRKTLDMVLAKNNYLETIHLELTYKCNLKCKHCFNPKDENNHKITFEEAKKIIDEAYDEGLLYVSLSGGECTLNKDFLKIAKYIKSKFIGVEILSNLQLLYDDNGLFNEIVNLYPQTIYTSLYSMNPNIHDNITGIKGSQFKTISVLKRLREKNINVWINYVPTAFGSCYDYEEILKFADKYGIKSSFSSGYIVNSKNGNICAKISEADLQNIYIKYFDLFAGSMKFEKDSHRICAAGSVRLCVSPDLNIQPCSGFPCILGNYKTTTIKKLRDTIVPEFQRKFIRKNLKGCFEHDYCQYCTFCPPCGDFTENDYLKKSELLCQYAKAYYNAAMYHKNMHFY